MLPDGDSAQVSGAARPRGGDRRAHPRVRAFPGGLSELLVAEVADFSGCFILDLGEGGMAVQLAGPAPPFPEFKVHFILDCGTLSIDAKARPAWRDGKGNLGLCFVEVTEECRVQFVEWLNGKRDQLEYGRTPDTTGTERFDGVLPMAETQAPPAAIGAAEMASVPPPDGNGIRLPEIALAPERITGSDTTVDIVARARELTDADGAALALPDQCGSLVCQASLGKAPKVGDPLSPSAGLPGQCIRTGQVVSCEDADLDLRVPFAVSRDLGLQSIVVVPLRANGKTVGVLEVTSCAKAAFTSDHIAALQQLAVEASSIGPSHVDHEAGNGFVPVTKVTRLLQGKSYHDPVFIQDSEHCKSAEELISKLRASSPREMGRKSDGSQPKPSLRDRYTKLAGVAKRRKPADFSLKSEASAQQVPWLWASILMAGTILVGTFAGWVLLVVEAPADFAPRFAPPSVTYGRVRTIRLDPKREKSHPASVEKRSDGRVELPEAVAVKQLLSSVDPKYPEEAALRQISGVVSLTLLIDRSGSVQGIEEVRGNRILADAAKKAVWQWQYRRFLFHGQAVDTLTRVRFLFTSPGT